MWFYVFLFASSDPKQSIGHVMNRLFDIAESLPQVSATSIHESVRARGPKEGGERENAKDVEGESSKRTSRQPSRQAFLWIGRKPFVWVGEKLESAMLPRLWVRVSSRRVCVPCTNNTKVLVATRSRGNRTLRTSAKGFAVNLDMGKEDVVEQLEPVSGAWRPTLDDVERISQGLGAKKVSHHLHASRFASNRF